MVLGLMYMRDLGAAKSGKECDKLLWAFKAFVIQFQRSFFKPLIYQHFILIMKHL